MFTRWFDNLLVRFRTDNGRNVKTIKCSTETFLSYLAGNKHTKLFRFGIKRYRSIRVELDDMLGYKEIVLI